MIYGSLLRLAHVLLSACSGWVPQQLLLAVDRAQGVDEAAAQFGSCTALLSRMICNLLQFTGVGDANDVMPCVM
jgi:hypothetical protein